MDSIFGFHLSFGSGLSQYLGCHTPEEREAWRAALDLVSHSSMRQQLDTLRATVSRLDRSDTGRELDTVDRAWVWPHVLHLQAADVYRGTYDVDRHQPAYAAYASTEIVEVK